MCKSRAQGGQRCHHHAVKAFERALETYETAKTAYRNSQAANGVQNPKSDKPRLAFLAAATQRENAAVMLASTDQGLIEINTLAAVAANLDQHDEAGFWRSVAARGVNLRERNAAVAQIMRERNVRNPLKRRAAALAAEDQAAESLGLPEAAPSAAPPSGNTANRGDDADEMAWVASRFTTDANGYPAHVDSVTRRPEDYTGPRFDDEADDDDDLDDMITPRAIVVDGRTYEPGDEPYTVTAANGDKYSVPAASEPMGAFRDEDIDSDDDVDPYSSYSGSRGSRRVAVNWGDDWDEPEPTVTEAR